MHNNSILTLRDLKKISHFNFLRFLKRLFCFFKLWKIINPDTASLRHLSRIYQFVFSFQLSWIRLPHSSLWGRLTKTRPFAQHLNIKFYFFVKFFSLSHKEFVNDLFCFLLLLLNLIPEVNWVTCVVDHIDNQNDHKRPQYQKLTIPHWWF